MRIFTFMRPLYNYNCLFGPGRLKREIEKNQLICPTFNQTGFFYFAGKHPTLNALFFGPGY
ncbi:hypothetical protein D1AOALGA4SA_11964 [Olavius algarvensis Delta 1 endosymbiont]|nr:hypothetical protein D1AOALGA4SA_11964 [Olavius algarvensis Delta 1 endosymbiont]